MEDKDIQANFHLLNEKIELLEKNISTISGFQQPNLSLDELNISIKTKELLKSENVLDLKSLMNLDIAAFLKRHSKNHSPYKINKELSPYFR